MQALMQAARIDETASNSTRSVSRSELQSTSRTADRDSAVLLDGSIAACGPLQALTFRCTLCDDASGSLLDHNAADNTARYPKTVKAWQLERTTQYKEQSA